MLGSCDFLTTSFSLGGNFTWCALTGIWTDINELCYLSLKIEDWRLGHLMHSYQVTIASTLNCTVLQQEMLDNAHSWACGRFLRLKYCITTLYRGVPTLCIHTPRPAAHNQWSKQYNLPRHLSSATWQPNLGVHLRAVLFSWSWSRPPRRGGGNRVSLVPRPPNF